MPASSFRDCRARRERAGRAGVGGLAAAVLLLASGVARAEPTSSELVRAGTAGATRTSILFALLLLLVMALAIPASHFVAARALRVRGLGFFGLRPAAEYFEASILKRMLIRAAGPATVWMLIALLAAAGIRLAGAPRATLRMLVIPGRAADLAGMQHGDRIVAVEGRSVENADEFRSRTAQHGAGPVDLEIERRGDHLVIRPVADERGKIGVMGMLEVGPVSILDSLSYGLTHPSRILRALRRGVRGHYDLELDGPISRVVHPMSRMDRVGAGDYFLVAATVGAVCLPTVVMTDALIAYLVWRNRRRKRERQALA